MRHHHVQTEGNDAYCEKDWYWIDYRGGIVVQFTQWHGWGDCELKTQYFSSPSHELPCAVNEWFSGGPDDDNTTCIGLGRC